ncbi:CvpA family protein [Roseomonas marmotae]|uniref:CvpA family protein n=1 Tax=Roseomonas marmotae TaxID=2768161 RepID=A0ABS3KFJ4_9PROT|nr:CvpA family protein [Roseomonas marmotae]MBO1075710.1 CvpA family protein [Roseomonas marmotae]QTI80441.1 CvpA family protein [Roseomonas marmotae]
MTWVDGVVLAVLAVSALIAYFRGFVREVLGIGAWVGAVAFALYAQPAVKPVVLKYLTEDWMAEVAALGLAFLAALMVLKLLIAWFAGMVRHSALGGVDRALGIVFGVARGAFLLVLAYIVGGLFLPSTELWPEAVRNARSLPVVADAASAVVSQLPAEYRPRLPELPERSLPSMDELLRPPARGRT